MSENPEKYKGKLPRPAKNQSVEEFENEEIKPDAEYTEFNTVKEILERPDYFSIIIEQPEFQAMLSRSKEYLKQLGEEGVDVSKFIAEDKKEKPDEKPNTEEPNTEDSEEPKAPIDVVMEPAVVEEVDEVTSVEAPKEKSLFEPSFKRGVNELNSPVEVKVQGGLITLEKSGLEDLLMPSSADRHTKDGRKIFDFRQQYRGAALIAPLKYNESDGMVSRANHSFIIDEELAGMASKTHKFEVETNKPLVQQASMLARNAASVNIDFVDKITTPNAAAFRATHGLDTRVAIDLAYDPRDRGAALGMNLKCADVMINPLRIPMLLHDQKVHARLSLTFDEFLAEHDDMINPRFVRLIRKRNAMERDHITSTKYKVSRYNRLRIRAPDSNDFYYRRVPLESVHLSGSILNRSFNKATDAMSSLTPSNRSITTHITNRQASSMLLNFSSILPSDGSTFMSRLCAFLLGGRGRVLSVDVDEASSKSMLIMSVASMANLLLLDARFLDERSKVQLLANVLTPFYDEFSMPTLRRNPNGRGLQETQSTSALDIALLIMQRPGAVDLPRISKFKDATGRSAARIEQIRIQLRFLINFALNREFTTINGDSRLFKTPVDDTFIPVIARDDIYDIVLYGERTDLGESFRHDVSAYRPEANAIARYLMDYVDILSMKMEFKGADMAMQEILSSVTHIAKSHAIVADAFIRGTMHTELLPATGGVDDSFYETVELPFTGALSYIMYGIGSSRVADNTNAYLEFTQAAAPVLPSLFPLYVFFERAIATEVYETYANDLIITKRDMMVDLVLDVLSGYFSTVDADSRSRIEYMFDAGSMVFRDAVRQIRLPQEFKTRLYTDAYLPGAGSKPGRVPGSIKSNDPVYEDVRPYEAAVDCVDKKITEVFFDFDPIRPAEMVTYNESRVLVYVKEEKGEYLDLEDIILAADYVESDTLTFEKLRNHARVYCETQGLNILDYAGVKVKSIQTSFKLVEHTGVTDIITETPSIQIMRNVEYKENKFKVDTIPIYYHRLTNYFRMDGRNREIDYLRSFVTYTSIDIDVLSKYLVNVDHIDVMNPLLYKTEEINDDKRLLLDGKLAKLRLRDGQGITYTGNMTLATREEEDISIVTELKSR